MNFIQKAREFDALKKRTDELEALVKNQNDQISAHSELEKSFEAALQENLKLSEQNDQLAAAIKKAGEDLSAEKSAHEAAKQAVSDFSGKVEKLASAKAQEILAASGSAPVKQVVRPIGGGDMKRCDFEKMAAKDRMEYIRGGGKITE